MRLFGSERIGAVMDKLGAEEGEVIEAGMVTKSIERAQNKVEGRNFEMRKHVLEYDDVMNQQRQVIYNRRRDVLERESAQDQIEEMIEESLDAVLAPYVDPNDIPEEWDWEGLQNEFSSNFFLCRSFLFSSGFFRRGVVYGSFIGGGFGGRGSHCCWRSAGAFLFTGFLGGGLVSVGALHEAVLVHDSGHGV